METEQEIRNIIALELGCEISEVTDDAMLEEDLGGDSLDATEIIVSVEHKFNIIFDDNIFENIKTVKDIIDKVHEKISHEKVSGK